MNIVTDIKEWQNLRRFLAGNSIGFVPTMGNLHAGHMSLCRRSKMENDLTIVSIFINPTQFNEARDYELYPQTLEQDITFLNAHHIDYLLLPSVQSIYPDHFQMQITETELSQELEGKYRPEHFKGMLTIVLKLLNITQPARAYFGEKDFQQLLLIKKMVHALFMPVDIIACETVRDQDNLALSSRNFRLNREQLTKAKHFPRLLHSSLNIETIIKELHALEFKVDYIVEKWQRRLGAVWLANVRLIDNIKIG